ncbi:MAG: aminotransferase class V-fold PLP-dependent enzyme [Planctomycetes bacterium]|nr:aminotransferase class V-fold PLP-dependent enzyme [Planctomycetota bacterium]
MDWTTLRNEFPVTRRWAFLDHAAVAAPSERARRVLVEWADDLAENGVVAESRWLKRVEEARQLFGRLLKADPLDVAFVKNTSEGIDFVAEGFPWRPGDNVITSVDEYPSNLYPWLNLESRGVEVRRIASRGPRVEIDDLRAAMDSRTRLVSLSFAEYASGFRNDLDAVGGLCRERGISFFVDAIQGLGVLSLDVQKTPIDFLSADGHKWLLGPEGAGVFYIRRDLVDLLRPISVGWHSVVGAWDFSTIDLTLKPHAGRWENGTLNVGGVAALGASLGLLLEIGIDAIEKRVLELTDYLCESALAAGVEVFSSRLPGDRSGIVSLVVPGDVKELVRRCRAAGIVVNQRAGRLRVSPHCYNTHEEIDRLVEVLTGAG